MNHNDKPSFIYQRNLYTDDGKSYLKKERRKVIEDHRNLVYVGRTDICIQHDEIDVHANSGNQERRTSTFASPNDRRL